MSADKVAGTVPHSAADVDLVADAHGVAVPVRMLYLRAVVEVVGALGLRVVVCNRDIDQLGSVSGYLSS